MDPATARERAWTFATTICPPRELLGSDLEFHGPSPIGALTGHASFEHRVVQPLARSFGEARKTPYIFLTGRFEGSCWSAATGDIVGVMQEQWLGIPPSDQPRTLRFGEFYRFQDDRIVEIRCLFDIPGLSAQAGIHLLPAMIGDGRVPPGPRHGNGIAHERKAGSGETELTFELVKGMIFGCNQLNGSDLASQGMERFWHEDMDWHGPWGIGSTHGMEDFFENAQGPSVSAFPGRRGVWPKACFIAEGQVSAQTGWPGLIGKFDGAPFRGIAPTGGQISQVIMDFYVRKDAKLSENWVLIDLIRFAADCGVDLLKKMPEDPALPLAE